MKFTDAMVALKAGKKVARVKWEHGYCEGKMYLSADNATGESRAYRPAIRRYSYDSSIFMCDGWFILGDEKEYFFHEIVDELYKGCLARLKEWGEGYIYYDRDERDLVYHSMEEFCYVPLFADLVAKDWEVVG